jgi:hypothetical protein
MKRHLLVAGFAVAALSTAAYAAGNYSTYPIVGEPSFCVSTVGVNGQAGITGQGGGTAGTNGAYCAQTVPAGPPALTGSELIPADTGLGGGAPPQTVTIPVTVLGAGASIYASPLTGTTVAVTPGTSNVVLSPAGTIAALTITLPAASSLTEGQILRVGSSAVVTALTLTQGTGTSITGGPTAIAAAGGFSLIYHASNATNGTWFRLN